MSAMSKLFARMIDAETGELIQLTKATWNGREGRVNLDYKSIVTTGTGVLSITENDRMLLSARLKQEQNYDRHPLLTKFHEEGPLNPMFHKRWNPRTGKVDPLPKKETPKKKKKKKIVKQLSEDDDSSSVVNSIELDPFVFLTQKSGITDIVGLAVAKSAETDALTLLENEKNNIEADDNISEMSVCESLQTEEGDDGPLTRAEKEAALRQNVLNQLYAIMKEADEIRNPRPYKAGGWTKAEKTRWKNDDKERKLQVIAKCEELADLRVRASRELHQAVLDEREREKKRLDTEAELKNPKSAFAKEVKRRHNEERERAKIYIRSLQYDNEVLLLSKLRREGILW